MFLKKMAFQKLPFRLRVQLFRAFKLNYFKDVYSDKNIVFIHVPKAAGTSINSALYGVPQTSHLKAKDFKRYNPEVFNKAYSFAVLRNPWDRLVSAYEFARSGGSEIRYHRANLKEKMLSRDFRYFLESLQELHLPELDPVFWPQSDFVLGADGSLLVNHCGNVESLSDTLACLKRETGVELQLENRNSSQRDSFDQYYSKDICIEIVADIYRNDIELGSYSFDTLSRVNAVSRQ
jgi:hypothetical protein